MTFVCKFLAVAAICTTTLGTSGWAAPGDQQGLLLATTVQLAPSTLAGPGMGMHAGTSAPDRAEQMKAMQEMHEKMLAASTPEERNALMAAQMGLMHNSMNMMGGMGGMGGMGHMRGGPMRDQPGDAARQKMMEQRMDMMQLMMDRMQSVPMAN